MAYDQQDNIFDKAFSSIILKVTFKLLSIYVILICKLYVNWFTIEKKQISEQKTIEHQNVYGMSENDHFALNIC